MNKTDGIHGEPPLSEWANMLESVCAACPRLGIHTVRVLSETGSTQDAAWLASSGREGWLVIAGRQTAGRGRLGREWSDPAGLGLAMTISLPAGMVSSVGVGLAVCRAAEAAIASASSRPRPAEEAVFGLRWPNDVVERGGARRKVAGVLIEVRDGVAFVGIGINVAPREWGDALRGRAVSLHELGGTSSRAAVACAVVEQLDLVAALRETDVAAHAMLLDTLRGGTHAFVHDGRRYVGLVESIAPDGAIRVRGENGVVELPAQATTLLREEP